MLSTQAYIFCIWHSTLVISYCFIPCLTVYISASFQTENNPLILHSYFQSVFLIAVISSSYIEKITVSTIQLRRYLVSFSLILVVIRSILTVIPFTLSASLLLYIQKNATNVRLESSPYSTITLAMTCLTSNIYSCIQYSTSLSLTFQLQILTYISFCLINIRLLSSLYYTRLPVLYSHLSCPG